jgi:hypothetical protein
MNEEVRILKKETGVVFLCFESDCRRISPGEVCNEMQGFPNATECRSEYV